MMAGYYNFQFESIPIPLDYRILTFSKKLGLSTDDENIVRNFWNKILSNLKHYDSRITMIHLDSLVWQIATLTPTQLISYFNALGYPSIGQRLAHLINEKHQTQNITVNKEIYTPIGRHTQEECGKSTNAKVVCFIPCCGTKTALGTVIKPATTILDDLPRTRERLVDGRKIMQYCIDVSSPKTSALLLYTGSPYNVLRPYYKELISLMRQRTLRLVIISAGYGIVDALEPIHWYDATMQGSVAKRWKECSLVDIIADFLLNERPNYIYGFFAGHAYWSSPGSKYRYFFTEGVRKALSSGLDVELAGCFYRVDGKGVKAILGALGRAFINLLRSNFDEAYVIDVYTNHVRYGNVTVGFDIISDDSIVEAIILK